MATTPARVPATATTPRSGSGLFKGLVTPRSSSRKALASGRAPSLDSSTSGTAAAGAGAAGGRLAFEEAANRTGGGELGAVPEGGGAAAVAEPALASPSASLQVTPVSIV